ncbi:hypothetical protein BsWGS_12505 [Bradybaena similaris]
MTYRSPISAAEESSQKFQVLSERKSDRPEHSIFMSARKQKAKAQKQKKSKDSEAVYRMHVGEGRKPSRSFTTKMASGHAGSNKLMFPAAGEDVFHKRCSDGDATTCSAKLDSVDINAETSKSPGKRFKCGQCRCSCIKQTAINANCAHLNITAVPDNLPNNTRALDMSQNSVRSLDQTSFLQLSNLTHLDFTSCVINKIYDSSFAATPKLTSLILRKNQLTYLSKSTFAELKCLQTLDLSGNNISKIEIGAFDQLRHLTKLDLSRNKHLGYSSETFSPLLFMKLKHVRMLYIHGNTNGTETSYPNKGLQQLKALQHLSIDGLAGSVEFGPELKDLAGLVHLEIKHTCKIENVSATFFENVPRLKFLLIKKCDVQSIHPEAYTKLQDLLTLQLDYLTKLSLDSAFQAMIGLNNSRLTSLFFNNLRHTVTACTYLNRDHSKYITNIKLRELDLSHNNIALITGDFFFSLPKTLKDLTLIGNKFAFSSGDSTWKKYANLKGLVYFDLSKQNTNEFYNNHHRNFVDDSPEVACVDTDNFKRNHETIISCKKRDNVMQIQNHLENGRTKPHYIDRAIYGRSRGTFDGCETVQHTRPYLNFPPNLKTLKVSHYQAFGMTVLANQLPINNSLSEIDFSNSFMSTWGYGVLPPGIVTAHLGENYCKRICPGFFQPHNSHKSLYLQGNFLGTQFARDKNGSIFAELTYTTHLDISRNQIYRLRRQFFKGLLHLKNLSISMNRLSRFGVTLKHMTQLQYIDLSKNAIRWIDQQTRNDLDAIAVKHTLGIDLTMNPLPCTCMGLEIILWMATTKVHFHKPHLLTCDSEDTSDKPMANLEETRKALQRFCMYKAIFIIGCVAVTTVIMITVGLGLMYRYRWKLRYLHNIASAAVFGFKPHILPNSGCTFDAYFVYTKETRDFVINTCITELELNRGHRLCVEDRDFLAGTYTVSNIVSAVRNSTKTVPVMTPTFYEGEFSEYSFKMAVMEELYNNRSVLHLLLYQPIPDELMTHDELKVMKRNSYIEYPPEEVVEDDIRQKFWDDLSLAIGHTKNPMPQVLPDLQQGM